VAREGRFWRKAGLIGSIAFTFPASIVVGYLLGRWLGQKLGIEPWLSATGLLLGAAAGFYEAFRIVGLVERMEKRERGERRQDG
jgi:F0F1-type ATP synthase assembly protein I